MSHAAVSVAYLGPQGSFTHAAARQWLESESGRRWIAAISVSVSASVAGHDQPTELIPASNVPQIDDLVASGRADFGVAALENSVEGYVVPTLDALVDSTDVVAVGQEELPISFNAMIRPDADRRALKYVSAHPHGLAQVRHFSRALGLTERPAASNAAACRDLAPDTVAIGPSLCAELYGLDVLERAVEDYPGAATRFVALTRRQEALVTLEGGQHEGGQPVADHPETDWATMLAVTPTVIGPGVLARVSAEFGRRGVNMSSLVTRPVKATPGQYVFVITCDGAPWDRPMRALLKGLLDAGDAVKTLGVFPVTASQRADHRVAAATVPPGSVVAASDAAQRARSLLWGN